MEERYTSYPTCLYYSANALSRIMTKMADEAFAPTGLSSSYAFLLMTVTESPGINPKDISCRMKLTPSTITRLIEKMEYRGFLERRQCGRNTEVFPTKQSQKLVPLIQKAWADLYEKYEEILGKEEARNLTAAIHQAQLKLNI